MDAPAVLHHIIIRGIERRKIFQDDRDGENFLERLGRLLLGTKTACYAWTFLGNHAHFLFRTGEVPIATLMRRLLTGYVVSFNRRYKRHGHLLQNRYKSIVCQEDIYLQELVRYSGYGTYGYEVLKRLAQSAPKSPISQVVSEPMSSPFRPLMIMQRMQQRPGFYLLRAKS